MKKLLIFVLLVIAGYLAYDNFIVEKDVVQIEANYNKMREGVDPDAPALSPREFAHYQGTIRNAGKEVLTNIVITYLIDAQESQSVISRLSPGEVSDFKTSPVMLRHMDPPHYLKEVMYDGK